jgi:hypothetical protein
MPPKIEVKSHDDAVKASREAVAQRVVDEFGNGLPDLRLLAFFDDEDWKSFKDHAGKENRGFYTPIKEGTFQCPIWPDYVMQCIFVSSANSDPNSGNSEPSRDSRKR